MRSLGGQLAFSCAALCWACAAGQVAPAPIPAPVVVDAEVLPAEAVFARFRADCQADRGALWGVSLCGPVLLVTEDGRVSANMADRENRLKRAGAIWTATLPKEERPIFSDTSAEWAGTRWAIIRHQPGRSALEYAQLALHESFHRIQPQLAFSVPGTTTSDHLDEVQGRLWLRLSLRALRAALAAPDRLAAREHVLAALAMSEYRHRLFPTAADTERQLELHEGLAEYTAWRLARSASTNRDLLAHLDEGDRAESYARSFAYHTGPAWGMAFDRLRLDWRRRLAAGAPGLVAAGRQGLRLSGWVDEARAVALAERYGYRQLLAQEQERGERIAAKRVEYRARFVEGPKLIVPLNQVNFDPRTVSALPGHGQVYGTLTVTGPWGRLATEQGALVNWARREIIVDLSGEPQLPSWVTPRWRLELNPDWKLERRGSDLVVVAVTQ
jgi:hypothetical protein